MSIYSSTIVRSVGLVALGSLLALSTMPYAAGAQSSTAQMQANTNASFNRNLTIGSTGSDVVTLQQWLINKGFSINAGATGYFGGQTQAALARYQASVGIRPAAGYFGPITRAQLDAQLVKPTPPTRPTTPDNDEDEDDNEDEELEIEVEIRNNRAHVEVEMDGDEDSFTLRMTDEDEIIEEIAERLDLSEDEVEDVIEFSNEDEDDDEDDDNDSGDTENIDTSAEATTVDGADNDYATFTIGFDLRSFGEDTFISRNASTAFTYQIENAATGEVVSTGSMNSSISSSADTDGGSYVIDEDSIEEFTFMVIFDPLAADEAKNYRAQLLTVRYGDDEGETNLTWTARPEGKYETNAVYISD